MRKRKVTDRSIDETAAVNAMQEKIIAKERLIKLANYENLLHNNVIAQDLLWDVLDMTGFNSIHHNPDNTLILAEGKRHVGYEIIDLLNEIDPMLYPTLIIQRGKRHGYREHDPDAGLDDNESES